MRTNVDPSRSGSLHAGHIGESPQIEISLKIFEGAAAAVPKEIGWHDFFDKPCFVVDLEGFSAGQPSYYDVIIIRVLILVAFLLSLAFSIVFSIASFRFTPLEHQMEFHRKRQQQQPPRTSCSFSFVVMMCVG